MSEHPEWLNESYDLKCVKEYVPPVSLGKVVKVYDGDTLTIVTKIHDADVCKMQVRINGVDTAEIKGSTGKAKKMAILARDQLKTLLDGRIIRLEQVCLEKYGRLLAQVYVGDVHINQWLIDSHLAVEYHGATKQSVEIWDSLFDTYWVSHWNENYEQKN